MRLTILLLAFSLGFPAVAQNRKVLTGMDEFQLELVQDPQISPDGSRIVYVRQFADILSDRRYSNLWIVNFDGTENRPLTTGSFSDTSPRWSPDGKQLLYLSNRDGSTQLYRRFMDSGEAARLTNVTQAVGTPAWSPDGKQIALRMFVPDAGPKIGNVPTAPEGAKWAEPAKIIDKLTYKFNGAGYLKPGYWHVFVVPAEGGTPRQVTSGNVQHGGPTSPVSDLAWTPDSQFILVATPTRGGSELERDTEIYEYRVSDGQSRALTTRKGPDIIPVVSPDGTKIAYAGFDDRFQGYQVTQLSVMNRDGSNARVLTTALDRDAGNFTWAPDNSGIYFTSDNNGNSGLYFVPLNGAPKQIAKNLGSGTSAYGSGAAYSVSKSNRIALTQCRPDRPGDIASLTPGAEPKWLTAVNEDLFAARKIGAVEEIWYESAKDKRKIQGWVVKPPDFDASKKYPLVLEIHGGPFANYGDRFDWEKQLMAAAGYVVVYTNPRGSTSYGGEFGNLIHHAYPGDDFFDLNSGVDAVIAKGYIDPERTYVTGGSGGGVLTSWMIGRTTRFRAAVTVYPVINWYSFVLTTDIPWTAKYWFPGLPWDNVDHYEKRSLLSVVKNVKTPTMVLTGEADYRTPMSESEQYFQALQILGVPSVLVRVPDEPHGIAVRPSHHIAKVAYIIGWFDKYGKPASEASGGTK